VSTFTLPALLNPADSFAPIALRLILALIAGALIGSAWDTWRERRRRRDQALWDRLHPHR
jgi:hypothetical protein